jgi:hypothetical protein
MEKEIAGIRLKYFVILWALVAYFEQIFNYNNILSPIELFAIFSALCLPWSLVSFFILSSVGFSNSFLLTNRLNLINILMPAFVNFVILSVFIYYFFRKKEAKLESGDIYSMFAPAVRIAFIGLYFFAFFSKLNKDYLNPQFGCAAIMVGYIQHSYYPAMIRYFFGIPWMKTAAIWVSVISEGSFPILLIFRRTRHLAIIWIFIFHFFIGLVPKHNLFIVSNLMFFTQFVFLSDAAVMRIHLWEKQCAAVLKRFIPTLMVRYAMIAVFVYLLKPMAHVYHWPHYDFHLWLAVYLLTGFIFGAAIFKAAQHAPGIKDNPQPFRDFFISRPAFPSILAVFFVISTGISPYIGTQIAGGFEVFSNTRIAGPKPNHFIVPTSLIIFNKDLITVLDTDHPLFRKYVGGHYLLTTLGFRLLASSIKRHFFVRILYQGKEMVISNEKPDDGHFLKPPSWLENKFIYLRVIDNRAHCHCFN